MKGIAMILLAAGLLSLPAFAGGAGGNAGGIAGMTVDAADVAVNASEVGSLPGDWDYGFKRFSENVDKFFTWDKSERALKHARYGRMRAMEAHLLSGRAQRLAAEGRWGEANATIAEVERLAAEQNGELEAAEEDIEAAVDEGSATEIEAEHVRNRTRNSIMVLQRVYENAPESAKNGLARALNNSINSYERHVERMSARREAMGQRQNQTAAQNWTQDPERNRTHAGNGQGNASGKGKGGPGWGSGDEGED
jgi:hypothetical protein